ncbi:hypothetical protein E1B28_002166 [Marasmius oreades]|uniref:DUF1275 domain protein n=1 Tax=Marasmius oreades TaxID=181124 RepID=A0A9P7RNL2_9AGAR|nr:uncharacterized protein E1B28_002166 [Marasmius oreades]KAG7086203.1 hypothetical protein E1B28_002166 [Marasmius oreades]
MAVEDNETTPLLPGASGTDRKSRIKSKLRERVDVKDCIPILILMNFITGFLDAISYTTLRIWAAFQTGNSIQLSLALSRLTALPNEIPEHSSRLSHAFTTSDLVAIASLSFFNLGAWAGGYLFNTPAGKTRGWMILSTTIQIFLTIISALVVLHPQPDDSDTRMRRHISLVVIAISLGMQGIQAKKLGTSQFGTSLVLTTAWVDMMNSPIWVPNIRDSKALPIISLIFGGFVGGIILRYSDIFVALGAVVLLRTCIVIGWWIVPTVSAT